tara:strand:- start:2726 stop:2926 length:201 start_codon:yes stop_codon:yes gene_type:complete
MAKDNRVELPSDINLSGAASDNSAGGKSPDKKKTVQADIPPETNGPKGPEPTRYGDWENGGRCTDF